MDISAVACNGANSHHRTFAEIVIHLTSACVIGQCGLLGAEIAGARGFFRPELLDGCRTFGTVGNTFEFNAIRRFLLAISLYGYRIQLDALIQPAANPPITLYENVF